MNQTYQDAVLKTVMFWSDKSFRTLLNQNNGDNSENGGMAFMLMNLVSIKAKEDVTQEKIKKFEEKLTELLMSKESSSPHSRTLSVDYHPNELLCEACEFADIDTRCLPCKTVSWIDADNKATARFQYGGTEKEL